MQVKLKDLVEETEFTLNFHKYQKGNSIWTPTKEISKNEKIQVNPRYYGKACRACHPKFGGKFQDKINVWIAEEEIVSVDP